jgi:maltose-binding protein MalE
VHQQAGQYDVASLSNFEIPIYAKAKWITSIDGFIAKDPGFDQKGILPPMTTSLSSEGKVYGEPFYGESSFLMYRKDILKSKGRAPSQRSPVRGTPPDADETAPEASCSQFNSLYSALTSSSNWNSSSTVVASSIFWASAGSEKMMAIFERMLRCSLLTPAIPTTMRTSFPSQSMGLT